MLRKVLWLLITVFAVAAQVQAAGLGYDPQADPFEQYRLALDEARAQHKLVLVVAGGDWCSWCHRLHRFVDENRDIHRQLDDTFVVMKVYIGDQNSNSFFFDQLPRAYGAPHFWVIAPDKTVLSSQSTAPFENGKHSYSRERLLDFIQHWDAVRVGGSAPDVQTAAADGAAP